MRRPLLVLAALGAALGAGCAVGGAGPTGAPSARAAGAATVVRVVDGDTLRARVGGEEEPVRLIGIDTPETHGQGGLRECFGEEAAGRLRALLPPGTAIRLVRDAEARDRYGRLLAYVYRAEDELFVNLALAREGYATTLTFPPNVAHVDELTDAVRHARDHDLGLWRRCGSADVRLAPAGGS